MSSMECGVKTFYERIILSFIHMFFLSPPQSPPVSRPRLGSNTKKKRELITKRKRVHTSTPQPIESPSSK